MTFDRLTPMIWVDDLDASISFYRDMLGFNTDRYNAVWGWAHISREGVSLMLARPNEHTPYKGPAFSGSFYIYTEQVEELWLSLKDKARIAYPIEDFEHGMREFAIYDNSGYMLQFGKEYGDGAQNPEKQ